MADRILVFASVHQTFKAEEQLNEVGYKFTVVPVPPYVNEGCGLGIKVEEKDFNKTESQLNRIGIRIIKNVLI